MSITSISFEQLVCASVIDAGENGAAIGREFKVAPFGNDSVRGACVADVLYLPQVGLQVLAGRIVPLEAVQNPWRLKFELERNFAGKAEAYRAPFETTHRDEEVCILANFYSRNFFHWITEELVKVAILERSGFSGRYVLANLPEFAMQFMALLGVGSDRILRELDGPTIFTSVVYVTAIRALTLDHHAELFFALRDMLVTPAIANSSPSRRLWMDRSLGVNNKGRELLNTEEVYPLLDRYGFEIVDMAALPVQAQIGLANSAHVLSGPHGAGFIHGMFMRPGSTLIECFSPLYVNPVGFEVFRLMRHRYFMMVYRNAFEFEGYPFGKQLKVDCSHLELTLQSLG